MGLDTAVRTGPTDAARPATVHPLATYGAASATDEDLVRRARDGDDVALVEILERYRRFARAKARPYFLAGGDRDDVVQEAMIGLYKAVRDYEPGHDTSFRSFADLCITRQVLTAVKAATRQKHAPLNAYVPIDRPAAPGLSRRLDETIEDEGGDDPVRRVLDTDELVELRQMVGELLSSLEIEVLDLYVEGRTYEEIAATLGRHVKSVDNAVQRIKRKLEQEFRTQLIA